MKLKKSFWSSLLLPSVVVILTGCGDIGSGSGENITGPQAVSYADDVRPILQANCVSCHSPGSFSGELDLSSHAALMQGGRSGDVVVAGSSSTSLLVDKISSNAVGFRMPPFDPGLTQSDISIIEEWINDGAPDN
jgi:hypothetical protein